MVSDDHEMTMLPGNDSDGTASDDELVIDLKDDGNSQAESEDEEINIVNTMADDIHEVNDSGTVQINLTMNDQLKVDISRLGHMHLAGLSENQEMKEKILSLLQNAAHQKELEDMDCSISEENDLDNKEGILNKMVFKSQLKQFGTSDYEDASSNNVKGDDQFEFKKFRNRREYTQEEQLVLLTHFQHNHFPPTRELKLLAKRLNITHRQIMHWFQNRRSKERKALPYSRRVSRQCTECKATFVHDQGLDNHKSESHDPASVGVKFVCSVKSCLLTFPSSVLLQTHEILHEKKENIFAKKVYGPKELTGHIKKTRRILVSSLFFLY